MMRTMSDFGKSEKLISYRNHIFSNPDIGAYGGWAREEGKVRDREKDKAKAREKGKVRAREKDKEKDKAKAREKGKVKDRDRGKDKDKVRDSRDRAIPVIRLASVVKGLVAFQSPISPNVDVPRAAPIGVLSAKESVKP